MAPLNGADSHLSKSLDYSWDLCGLRSFLRQCIRLKKFGLAARKDLAVSLLDFERSKLQTIPRNRPLPNLERGASILSDFSVSVRTSANFAHRRCCKIEHPEFNEGLSLEFTRDAHFCISPAADKNGGGYYPLRYTIF